MSFFYEIYSSSAEDVIVKYTIQDNNRGTALHKFDTKSLNPGKNTIDEIIDISQIKIGEFELLVELKDDNNNTIKKASKKFYSKLYGFPTTILDLDLAIEQMIYIASNSTIDQIKNSDSFNEKLRKFKEFWKEKDPSQNTEENEILTEYYRRVEYANQNFKSYYPGWRTDMGMVYITLGPPNQVERHPFEIDTKPYEIWDYFDFNKRFLFIDQSGFGDYRLSNPEFGDWYRYRY